MTLVLSTPPPTSRDMRSVALTSCSEDLTSVWLRSVSAEKQESALNHHSVTLRSAFPSGLIKGAGNVLASWLQLAAWLKYCKRSGVASELMSVLVGRGDVDERTSIHPSTERRLSTELALVSPGFTWFHLTFSRSLPVLISIFLLRNQPDGSIADCEADRGGGGVCSPTPRAEPASL